MMIRIQTEVPVANETEDVVTGWSYEQASSETDTERQNVVVWIYPYDNTGCEIASPRDKRAGCEEMLYLMRIVKTDGENE